MSDEILKPESYLKGLDDTNAVSIRKGIENKHDGFNISDGRKPHSKKKVLPEPNITDYYKGVVARDRAILGKTLTLIESNSDHKFSLAQDILKSLIPLTSKSVRIGITGSPGVGKSTFIESFGMMLCDNGYRVAVLAIDPSSSISRGSILGDKTRMDQLSRHPNAFIRPSPSGGTLGGVTRKTRESVLVCEAAGFDIILIETVGVGQSETTVRSMVDFFMLLIQPGAGDELQGIKKGIVELSDLIVVNKADGDYVHHANSTASLYRQAIHYLSSPTPGWTPEVKTCSSIVGSGILEIWNSIEKFISSTKSNGFFDEQRKNQLLDWVRSMTEDTLIQEFNNNPKVKKEIPVIYNQVLDGTITPSNAVAHLLSLNKNS